MHEHELIHFLMSLNDSQFFGYCFPDVLTVLKAGALFHILYFPLKILPVLKSLIIVTPGKPTDLKYSH